MRSKSCCSREQRLPAIRSWTIRLCIVAGMAASLCSGARGSGDAPGWMHSLAGVPLPAHDEKTDAVLLYSENVLTVQTNGKIKTVERRAYKILRPGGKQYGMIRVDFDTETRITTMHGWCIPAQGKDYEVKDKDAMETSLFGVSNGELASDVRTKLLQIPAADPGNIVGYELEHEDRPYVLEDEWMFQDTLPAREARYTLQLPPGWEYKATFLNHADVKPAAMGNNQWQWVVSDVAAVKGEEEMPPWKGIAGVMMVSFFPPGGGAGKGFESWREMGLWEAQLDQGRFNVSPELKQKVQALTSGIADPLGKMKALAKFLQGEIRYVAIELGIGGLQPHPAADVFAHRYGDCKDKATLLATMMREIGIDAYLISINTRRGGAAPERPAMVGWFNHEILAVKLPDGVKDPSLVAIVNHPKLGRLLIFDPTDEYTPFGQIRGELQSNYGLLVAPEGGDLIQLPQSPVELSGVRRTAKLSLNANGVLAGDVAETRLGDAGLWERMELKSVKKDADRLKTVENLVSHSLTTYQITKATILNLHQTDQPFGYQYSISAPGYAKTAGNLLLVRPRVIDSKSSSLLETKEPRRYPVEFTGPERDEDTFEITLPTGYEVEDLPPEVNVDYGFASYHSKTEAVGNVLKYTRTFETKQVSVAVNKVDDLKKLYRIIAGDERNTAVLKPTAK